MKKERLIKGKDYEEIKDWAQDIVKQWHSKDPDYIFLTETAGTLYGYVLKETWKKAYPNEKPPAFYRIDPAQLEKGPIWRSPWDEAGRFIPEQDKRIPKDILEKEKEKYLKKRIKKKNPKIIVFDEGTTFPEPDYFKEYSKELANGTTKKTNSAQRTGKFIYEFLKNNKREGKIYLSRQGLNLIREKSIVPPEGIDIKDYEDLRQYGGSRRPTSKRWTGITWRSHSNDEQDQFIDEGKADAYFKGRIVKNPEERKKALEYVKELKEIGREAGEELEKRGALEKRLTSIIAISSLAISLVFLSSNITGNTISNLTNQTSNLIGGALFVIGIVGGYFWFKKSGVAPLKRFK